MIDYLNSEPVNLKKKPLEKWKELGPLNIIELIKNADDELNMINFERVFGKSTNTFGFEIMG
jgi:hypothetical protein